MNDGARAAPVDLFALSPGHGATDELLRILPKLAAGGIRRFLLREKGVTPADRARLAEAVAQGCRAVGLELWIAEEVALARAVGATGVQLSERSPSPGAIRAAVGDTLRLGISLHRPVSRTAAEIAACDHAFLAPVYAAAGKATGPVLGVAGFVELAATLPIPSYALGGVGLPEVAALARAGVRRVAAIRLLFDAADPVAAARAALRELAASAVG